MTTREGEARPAEQASAGQEPRQGNAPSPAVTRGDGQGTGQAPGQAPEQATGRAPEQATGKAAEPLSGRIAAPPNDAKQLELEIERTREQLGETVQELLARADVKSRALAKASEVSQKYKSTVAQARNHATTRAAGVRSQMAGKPAWEAMPGQVRRALTKGASAARKNWIPLAAATGVVIIGYLAVRHGRCDRRAPREEG